MNIARARIEDLDLFVAMRRDAAAWLAAIGSDQWGADWPDQDGMRTLIKQALAAGTGWTATIGGQIIASWLLDTWANPDLWTPAEQAEPAMYLHRLIVDRAHAGRGHGVHIINWCARHAAEHGATWLRIDAWTTNHRLHRYYQQQGFQHVRTRHLPHNPSGWLAQRAT